MLSALFLLLAASAQDADKKQIILLPGLADAVSIENAEDICASALNGTERIDAMKLLLGSGACTVAEREVEASFLFNIGIIRGAVDYLSLLPSNAEESDRQRDLLLFLFYSASNVGSDFVLREKAQREELIQRLSDWVPYYANDYDPGWIVGEFADVSEYQRAIDEMRTAKLMEISRVSKLVSDPEYWQLHLKYLKILEELQSEGTEDQARWDEIEELQELKLSRAAELGDATAVAMMSSRNQEPLEQQMARVAPDPNVPHDATIVEHSDTAVVSRCRQAAKRDALESDGRVLAEIITKEEGIGIVYRADVEDGPSAMYPGVTRHYCSTNFTGSTPLGADAKLIPAR